jgi:hypothetical protein
MKLGAHNQPAPRKSNWPLLNDFWGSVGQHHAPPPSERGSYDTQLLDKVAQEARVSPSTVRQGNVEHLEALLFERKPSKRHFGDSKQ